MIYATIEQGKLHIKEFEPKDWYDTYNLCFNDLKKHNVGKNMFALLCEEDLCGMNIIYKTDKYIKYRCMGPYYNYDLIVGKKCTSLKQSTLKNLIKKYRGCIYETTKDKVDTNIFTNIKTINEYERKADELANKSLDTSIFGFVSIDGKYIKYDRIKNEMVWYIQDSSMKSGNRLITYFKPKNGVDYYNQLLSQYFYSNIKEKK